MKTEKFNGTIESAYGQPVKPALKFSGTYEAFNLPRELEKVKLDYVTPDGADVITDEITVGNLYDFVNNQRKANARQKEMQSTLDAAGYVKPNIETDDQLQLRTLYKVFILQPGSTEASARAMAENALGKKFAA